MIDEERFFNWQVAFPNLFWQDWEASRGAGGLRRGDRQPPGTRMKRQQRWSGSPPAGGRSPWPQRAASRKRMIAELEQAGDPVGRGFTPRPAGAPRPAVRVARRGGDYPLLSGGDVNIYSLFVERAMALVRPDGHGPAC